ncbi:hypothetical protein IW140_001473 [Coemansia sp. RSA 1813]|nr:hypothetical protein EV178_003288 [Coemansia sp. RSA 1646]KAJ1771545.1 hypothetical protein LPJ74_002233 [Coemansia sp. RSA 1843]KAJ2089595.1 hypothetical protein IW138_003337 [Coemansia sp. RSA 986]KAJ2214698.1 hypothetical protein EV179_002803 [Coemansia sp. RSA 487]KAJ2571555.1 hypothetical protein IW140_001473 [Coemansia sp. RSA 1813]
MSVTDGTDTARMGQLQKFQTIAAQHIVSDVLRSELGSAKYEADEVAQLSKRIGETINKRLSEEPGSERYKYVTNVSIFQNEGQGARMSTSTIWDPESDAMVQEMFANESIRCVAVVFAVYVY